MGSGRFHQTMMQCMKCGWRHCPSDKLSDQRNMYMYLKIIIEINLGA